MSDGRNVNWTLHKDGDKFSTDQATLGVLMDIRDELKTIRTILKCQNFQNIPRKLDRISFNTHRPKKRKTKKITTATP